MGKHNRAAGLGERWPHTFKDHESREIVLRNAAWRHIVQNHPDVTLDTVRLALADPHLKQVSDRNPMRVSYYHFMPKSGLYIMVVTDWSSDPPSICTSFLTKEPKKGELLHVRKPDDVV